ncbi:MAG: type II toxin-antitoxin system VapC family toxin [Nitrospirae bacterium]|nr:type II toxin-antitoxin system VapC family toxin [Nitrospirota bacterium]MDA1304611.1 type II toxin-antitoxin system VapC family toxin [Nitrospirota bacterium]
MVSKGAEDSRFLFDTNAILYFLGGVLADPLPKGRFWISVITEIELLSYPSLTPEEAAKIKDLFSDIAIIGLTSTIKEEAITLRRNKNLKVPDAIIAASAKILQATLLTNDRSMKNIPDISIQALRLR